jgi:hypothetical protein
MTTPTSKVLKQTIRDAGGIVHSDGNIFFTNADQFQRAAIAAASAVKSGTAMQPLTDDEIRQIWGSTELADIAVAAHHASAVIDFARAIEAAHGITKD